MSNYLISNGFWSAMERLVDYTYAYVWLFQVMALSASLYGCQVWSTPFLHPSKAERTVLSRSQALFFKRVLGLPYTASTRCVLRECGQLPLQFYWARCVLRFWNACFNSRNLLVYNGLRAEWHLAVHCQHTSGWVAELLQYLEEPGEQHTWKHQFADSIRNFAPVNVNQFARLWVVADLADWRVYEGREPFYVSHPQLSRVLCTYHTCFAVRPYDWLTWRPPTDRRSTAKPSVPKYFTVPLRPDLRSALARFRLGAHPLRVALGRRIGERYEARSCTLTHACRTLQYIQDEEHVLFRCQHPTFCALRGFYEYLFDVCGSLPASSLKVHVFMNQRDVVEVAKFVQRLQLAVWDLMEVPTNN